MKVVFPSPLSPSDDIIERLRREFQQVGLITYLVGNRNKQKASKLTDNHQVEAERGALDLGEALARERLEAQWRRQVQGSRLGVFPWTGVCKLATGLSEGSRKHTQ